MTPVSPSTLLRAAPTAPALFAQGRWSDPGAGRGRSPSPRPASAQSLEPHKLHAGRRAEPPSDDERPDPALPPCERPLGADEPSEPVDNPPDGERAGPGPDVPPGDPAGPDLQD